MSIITHSLTDLIVFRRPIRIILTEKKKKSCSVFMFPTVLGVCACVFNNPLSAVALAVKRGAGQILRAGQKGKATPLPALSRMVGTRQLRE